MEHGEILVNFWVKSTGMNLVVCWFLQVTLASC
jgi:hypothetical protein